MQKPPHHCLHHISTSTMMMLLFLIHSSSAELQTQWTNSIGFHIVATCVGNNPTPCPLGFGCDTEYGICSPVTQNISSCFQCNYSGGDDPQCTVQCPPNTSLSLQCGVWSAPPNTTPCRKSMAIGDSDCVQAEIQTCDQEPMKCIERPCTHHHVAALHSTNPRRHVSWYTALADQTGPAQVADSWNASTGYLSCCNQIMINQNGSLSSASVASLSQQVSLGLGRPVVHTVRVDDGMQWLNTSSAASAHVAIHDLANLAEESGAGGLMVDFEPAGWKTWERNKTRRVAQAYASWATILADELHSRKSSNMTVGLDLAGDDGGSPIDLFDIFASEACAVIDDLFLMGTYHGKDSTYARSLVTRALDAGIPPHQLSVGLGSTAKGGNNIYDWNATSLSLFVQWVKDQGVTRLGVWRSDLDVNVSACCHTEPWFVNTLEEWLVN